MVATSDGRKKSEMEVSANWCVVIEHQGSSSIRVIFIDYQTSELECNYWSYIQGYTIEDAWSFSSIASIIPSGGFSSRTLIGA